METTLSIIATIISSMALIGVTVGLILQNRQLKASQIQLMREMHLELTKMAIENPSLAASIYGSVTPSDVPRASFLNFSLQLLITGYSLKAFDKRSLHFQSADLFSSEYSRNWWGNLARNTYQGEVRTRREKEAVAIIDDAFNAMTRSLQVEEISAAAPQVPDPPTE